MKEIFEWLIDVEQRAYKLYDKASTRFGDERDFSVFLQELRDDEKEHASALELAAGLAGSEPGAFSVVYPGGDERQDIEARLVEAEKRVERQCVNKEEVLESVLSIESSELNDIFLYVLSSFMGRRPELKSLAAKMQQHKRGIERYLEPRPVLKPYLERIRGFPKTWKENLLVVDSERLIIDVLASVLSMEGAVDAASDGREALARLNEKYYAAIVTDVDLPVMNGIELLEEAAATYPNINRRFLFFTSNFDSGRISYFKENGLRFMAKPAKLREIREAVASILKG